MILRAPDRRSSFFEFPIRFPSGTVLVKVEAAGICRTDLHVVVGSFARALPDNSRA
jgi:D-arabinose 1-dehydrogenase-like Zn-dependent alcohol dehydrogenase